MVVGAVAAVVVVLTFPQMLSLLWLLLLSLMTLLSLILGFSWTVDLHERGAGSVQRINVPSAHLRCCDNPMYDSPATSKLCQASKARFI
jgi:hypothetical protein